MRADRLIQIVLLLQQRHMLSARELAEALGVSRRTIFRDIEALCMIGIPIYAELGILSLNVFSLFFQPPQHDRCVIDGFARSRIVTHPPCPPAVRLRQRRDVRAD